MSFNSCSLIFLVFQYHHQSDIPLQFSEFLHLLNCFCVTVEVLVMKSTHDTNLFRADNEDPLLVSPQHFLFIDESRKHMPRSSCSAIAASPHVYISIVFRSRLRKVSFEFVRVSRFSTV